MKKLFSLLLIPLAFLSIGVIIGARIVTPKVVGIDTKKPCVVESIAPVTGESSLFKTSTGPLILPAGAFKVGDTISMAPTVAKQRLLASFMATPVANRLTSSKTGKDTTLELDVSVLRITPGLLVGFNKDTLEVGYERDLILGKVKEKK